MSRDKDPRVAYVMHTVDRLARLGDGELLQRILCESCEFSSTAWTRPRILAVFAALMENAPAVALDTFVEVASTAMRDGLETQADIEASDAHDAHKALQEGSVQ